MPRPPPVAGGQRKLGKQQPKKSAAYPTGARAPARPATSGMGRPTSSRQARRSGSRQGGPGPIKNRPVFNVHTVGQEYFTTNGGAGSGLPAISPVGMPGRLARCRSAPGIWKEGAPDVEDDVGFRMQLGAMASLETKQRTIEKSDADIRDNSVVRTHLGRDDLRDGKEPRTFEQMYADGAIGFAKRDEMSAFRLPRECTFVPELTRCESLRNVERQHRSAGLKPSMSGTRLNAHSYDQMAMVEVNEERRLREEMVGTTFRPTLSPRVVRYAEAHSGERADPTPERYFDATGTLRLLRAAPKPPSDSVQQEAPFFTTPRFHEGAFTHTDDQLRLHEVHPHNDRYERSIATHAERFVTEPPIPRLQEHSTRRPGPPLKYTPKREVLDSCGGPGAGHAGTVHVHHSGFL